MLNSSLTIIFILSVLCFFGCRGSSVYPDNPVATKKQSLPTIAFSKLMLNPVNTTSGAAWSRYRCNKKEISYANYDSKNADRHKLDLYRPINQKQAAPLVIFLHSGGMVTGNKENHVITQFAGDFGRHGFVVASVNYRLIDLPDSVSDLQRFLTKTYVKSKIYNAMQDVRTAIRYLSARAEEYNIDPNRIYLAGFSAGGILSLQTAFCDDEEMKNFVGEKVTLTEGCLDCKPCIGAEYSEPLKLAGVISLSGSMFNIADIDDTDTIPLLMVHGDADKMVDYKVGRPFSKYIKEYKMDLPDLVYEFGITQKKGDTVETYNFKGINSYLSIPEDFPALFVNIFTSDMYGSSSIYEKVHSQNVCSLLRIENGRHTFMKNEDGSFNGYYAEVRQKMLDFINENQ